ncbi:Histone-lysine N-methyltransferase, H3 lysine-79 specific [Golovinomyces cichoracearum]|uniref:Histone-lysine N-methyltransferase, H3 lysine-79 specific n=1 Tax=Golovinomyces cichoracearum TaxID=62708 RepID=A0A420J2A3_9PEZI|nr:Histone-lysine N-methyltransferase, H3 lysine-79 specific [Golovinomyces cichoracearum]
MNSIFHNKSFPIKVAPVVIRTERVRGPPKSKSSLSDETKSKLKSRDGQKASSTNKNQREFYPHSLTEDKVDNKISHRKSRIVKKRPLTSLDSDTSDSENNIVIGVKSFKRRELSSLVDKKRNICLENAFSGHSASIAEMIHAAAIVSSENRSKKKTDGDAIVTLDLKYPSSDSERFLFSTNKEFGTRLTIRYRYALIFGNDFNPAEEIINVIKVVLDFYFAKDQAICLKDSEKGLIRKLNKYYNIFARNVTDIKPLFEFKNTVEIYNSAIEKEISNGTFIRNLGSAHHIPLYMVEFILQQTYSRAVSPNVEILKKYENGTDNVYGELLPPFVSKILYESGLTSEGVFVDLGSGVGNVVLQAALEFGCESWGCEILENVAALAESQKKEFDLRCQLWGIKPGSVHLEHGDFLENKKIHVAMQRADVILVNNQAFTPVLNQNLKDLFLDVKDGCRIISLKSFLPYGQQISTRNLWDPANLLDVTEAEYHSRSVSWTDAGGRYYIARKDEKRLMCFNE